MLVPKPPIEFLPESVGHMSYLGEGDYNKPLYSTAVIIQHVRIDRNPVYSFNASGGKQILHNATVFFYEGLTTPLPTFKEQDVLVFDDKQHVITTATELKEPFENLTYSYELGVI